ncbi:hypothetical protein OEZ85_005886 [Tetradesmus obliquus]|uniref:Uncharacterized protein n=1 Tax=Tetradesmus obliquus TaxID=3088 RepID=A0ABY8UET3_TETOB|nr:hypothetical protein OEZ85_005886 [Tetradesmus obliquus]
MRVKPGRSRPAPLSPVPSDKTQSLNAPKVQVHSYYSNDRPEQAVHELVERRVRSSLKLIQRGELTPSQALRAVVNCLADELTDSQYHCLLCYFKAKQAKGQLAPAKQLLLQQLYNAKAGLPATAAASTRDQERQTAAFASFAYPSHGLPSPASKIAVGCVIDAAKGSAADQEALWRGTTTAGVFEPVAVKQQSQQQQQQQQQQLYWTGKAAALTSDRLQLDV